MPAISPSTIKATTLTGTLSTAAQPNVTSVGTLTSLTTAGIVTLNSTSTDIYTAYQQDGTTRAYVGVARAAGGLIGGSSANDFAIRTQGGAIRFSTDSGVGADMVLAADVLTVAGGLTVSAGTTAVQALTATTVQASSTVRANGNGYLSGFTGNISTVATSVVNKSTDVGGLTIVAGNDAGNIFSDLVFWSTTAGATVLSAKTVSGGPAGRTYTVSSGVLQLAMASGTYAVTCAQLSL